MQKTFSYTYKDKEYPVVVTYKKVRRLIYRCRDGVFYVSCPRLTPKESIMHGLNKFAPKLIEYDTKEHASFTNDTIYIFGKEVKYNPNGGEIKFTDGTSLKYLDGEDLLDKVKQIYLDFMIKQTRYYEYRMGISEPYRVRLRTMKTRFGTNSKKTHTITYADHLYGYSTDILTSLVVHELSHHFVYDHSNEFYKIVRKYCPNYDNDNKKLKRRIYQ